MYANVFLVLFREGTQFTTRHYALALVKTQTILSTFDINFATEIILVFNCDAQNYCNNRYSTGTINKFDTVEGNDTTKNKTAQHEVSQG